MLRPPLSVAIVLFAWPSLAAALAFEPTDAEWPGWPEYCQARYMVSGAGADSKFFGRVDERTVKNWESRMGPTIWYSLHHYCAGLILANRARSEPDPNQRLQLRKRVVEEYQFTLSRIPDPHPMRAEVAARQGLAFGELGEIDHALQRFDMAISDCPTCAVGYHSKAMYFRAQGKLEEARSALESGDRAMEGQSAEIHYILGLVLMDMKDFATAKDQARQAYALGYPLPGLRELLAKAGHPLD